jgi:NADH-quinone oxidoreductase subunit K
MRIFVSYAHYFMVLFGPFVGIAFAFLGMSLIKNPIRVLICIEVMFLCLSFILVVLSIVLSSITLQVFSLFILAVAACETALVLSLIILFFRSRGLINFDDLCSLKG